MRVLNLDCGFGDPLALVVKAGKHFLKVSSSAFLRDDASIGQLLESSSILLKANGRKEPAKLVRPACESCAYTIVGDQIRVDSISSRIALARARFETESASEKAGAGLRAAAARMAYEEDSLKRVRAEKERVAYINSTKWAAAVKAAIIARKIRFRMTREQVRLSWGEPDDINRTVVPGRVREQWVYGREYVYFDNGVVTAWQD